MYIAKVIGKVISTDKLSAYDKRTLLLVKKFTLEGKLEEPATIAIDYVGAGEGDTVLVGAAPGLASTVFKIPNAPIRELVMGIIDYYSFDSKSSFPDKK